VTTLLEVRGLTVKLPPPSGWVRPINEVSLRIDAGESLGLVGDSGSFPVFCKRCWYKDLRRERRTARCYLELTQVASSQPEALDPMRAAWGRPGGKQLRSWLEPEKPPSPVFCKRCV